MLVGAAVASADEVRLRDGDRYTGRVTGLADGTLRLAVTYGALSIPWNEVVSLTVDEALAVRVGDASPVTATIASAGDGMAWLVPGGLVALAEVMALTRPALPLMLMGGVNAGFLASGGNSEAASVRLDGEVVARTPRDRYTFRGAVTRASDRGTTTSDNWSASLRYDRFISARFYLNSSGIFAGDRFRDLDLRSALGLGVGYEVFRTPRASMGLEGGYGLVDERFDGADDNRYSALREAVTFEIQVAGPRVVAFHQNDGYFGVTGTDNLFLNTLTGVRASLVGGLVATGQYDFDYDRSPAPGRRHTDRAFALTFGYRF